MKIVRKLVSTLIGLITIWAGVSFTVTFFPHITPSFGAVINYEYPMSGFLWILLSFLKGIVLILFGVGIFVKWPWSNKVLTVLFVALALDNLFILIAHSINSDISIKRIFFDGFIIIMYLLGAVVLNLKFVYRNLYEKAK